MGSFKERVKEAPAPHAAPPSTALLPRGLGTGLAAVRTGGGNPPPRGPSPVAGFSLLHHFGSCPPAVSEPPFHR